MTATQQARDRDEGPNWREHARRLARALRGHRRNMHQASNRPCATCRFGQLVIEAYLADAERERI